MLKALLFDQTHVAFRAEGEKMVAKFGAAKWVQGKSACPVQACFAREGFAVHDEGVIVVLRSKTVHMDGHCSSEIHLKLNTRTGLRLAL